MYIAKLWLVFKVKQLSKCTITATKRSSCDVYLFSGFEKSFSLFKAKSSFLCFFATLELVSWKHLWTR